MASMKDVAQHAGVSIATVSNVITGKRAVSEKKRKKVLQSIEALHYQVNLVARGLKTQRTNTIGIILPDITKLFFQKMLIGILDIAYANGYRVNIVNSHYDFETERALVRSLRSSCVDGILLDSCVNFNNSRDWAAELVTGGKGNPPVVSIESFLDPDLISSVTVDNAHYTACITQHLIDCGKRSIFYISGPLHLEHEYARFTGFLDCLNRNDMTTRAQLHRNGAYLSESGYVAVKEALEEGISFDAVQASSDQAAIGALKALLEHDLRVPEDVAVSGFDNLFPGTLVSPAVTTVNLPAYELGATAVKELLRKIECPGSAPVRHILEAGLIIRSSTTPDAQSEWDLSNW